MTSTVRRFPWLIMIAVVLAALMLRGPIVAVAPVIDQISGDLGFSAAQAGALTGIPVLCFAAFTPLALLLSRRVGPNVSLTIMLVGVIVGIVIRSLGDATAAFAGTIVIGAFIAIGNLVIPIIVRRDVDPLKAPLAIGIYTSALNVGSTATSLATAPLEVGLGWRVAIAASIVIGVIAIAAWMVAVGTRGAFVPQRSVVAEGEESPAVWGSLTAILLVLAFCGQAFSYYGVTAWLPSLLADELGYTAQQAGSGSSIFQVMAIVGALGIPFVISRFGRIGAFVIAGAMWLAVPVGLLLAPDLWFVWSVLAGAAQGSGFTIVISATIALAASSHHAGRLGAVVQAGGYLAAATSPSILGAAHEATGGWDLPLVCVLIALLVFITAGVAASLRIRRATA